MKPHYGRIRRIKTHSGSTAIQVGFYKGKRFQLTKHIGSSKDAKKISELFGMARVIELEKKESIKKVTDELKDKWAILLTDEISGNSLKVFLDKKPH